VSITQVDLVVMGIVARVVILGAIDKDEVRMVAGFENGDDESGESWVSVVGCCQLIYINIRCRYFILSYLDSISVSGIC
jgi:hypothetical protein